MKNKLQIFDFIQIFVGLFLGIGTKILENITIGDIRTLFAVLNLCSFIYFVKGIINVIEDKYEIKVLNFKVFNYSK